MTTASAQPVYRSAAHRKAVMQHIGATLPPAVAAFAGLAPLAGLILIWGSTFVAMLCQVVTGAGDPFVALATSWEAIVAAYIAAAVPAAMAGAWIALFSPFAVARSQFLAGSAAIGAVTTFLFMAMSASAPGAFGGALFLSVVGAVSAFICAWLLQDTVLKRDESRRDTLSRDRAERLAKERGKI